MLSKLVIGDRDRPQATLRGDCLEHHGQVLIYHLAVIDGKGLYEYLTEIELL